MGFNDQQNKRISNFIIDELRLNPVSDDIPKKVNNSIQPTFEVNNKFCNIVATGTRTTSGTLTALTTSSTVDTYITAVGLGLMKDATNDATTGRINLTGTVAGTAQVILSIPFLTLTALSAYVYLSLPTPIKLDRNTTVTATLTFTAGTASFTGTVIGYTQETGDVTPA